VVDDGSTDDSCEVICSYVRAYPEIIFIPVNRNMGNCAAFNLGWKQSTGSYLIDLAADDVLMPDRVEKGIQKLRESGAGIHFSDALLMDVVGQQLGRHNERFSYTIPEGDLYSTLVAQYLICPPTMMFTREVMEYLGGYDESLQYEDFDFWVRSSRYFTYAYTDEVLVKKRVVPHSHSASQAQFLNKQQRSTLKVCKKALAMNRNRQERLALRRRCWHEIRQCIKKGNLALIPGYLSILAKCRD